MIIGMGIDIIDISRVRSVLDRHHVRFMKRVFTLAEIEYCSKQSDPSPCLAARFAAKEAALKALGGGLSKGIRFKDVEVDRSFLPPSIRLYGNAKEIASFKGVSDIHLSLSHERDHAIAIVVMEGR